MFGVPVHMYYHEDQKIKKSVLGAAMTLVLFGAALSYLCFEALEIRDPAF